LSKVLVRFEWPHQEGGDVVIIGVSQTIQFKRRNSRLGELNHVYLYFYAYLYVLYHVRVWSPFAYTEIRVSGIFPETAWRVMNHRQATHQFVLIFGSVKRNRLAAHPWPPSDTWLQPRFSGFLLNCLAVMSNRQAIQTTLARFWCFA